MLLEHSAGWFDMGRAEFDSADPTPLTLAQALALNPDARISQWPPSLHASYSNTGPGVAGYVLEQASGERFEAFAQQHIFAPLPRSEEPTSEIQSPMRLSYAVFRFQKQTSPQ